MEMTTLLRDSLGVQRQKKPRRCDHEEPSELRDLIPRAAEQTAGTTTLSSGALISAKPLPPPNTSCSYLACCPSASLHGLPPACSQLSRPCCQQGSATLANPSCRKPSRGLAFLPAGGRDERDILFFPSRPSAVPAVWPRGAFVQSDPKGWERRGYCHRAAGSSAPPSDRLEQGSKTQAPEVLMELKTCSFRVLGMRKDTPARHFTALLLSLMGNALLRLPLVCRVG